MLTEDLRIHHVLVCDSTASTTSPPKSYCQESAPTYLPAYTSPGVGISEDEEEKEEEDCQGQTTTYREEIFKLNYLKLLLTNKNMILPDVFVVLCL